MKPRTNPGTPTPINKSDIYLVVLLGDDERQGRPEYLGHDRSKVVSDAHGKRNHLSEPKLENDQDSHIALVQGLAANQPTNQRV